MHIPEIPRLNRSPFKDRLEELLSLLRVTKKDLRHVSNMAHGTAFPADGEHAFLVREIHELSVGLMQQIRNA